MTHFVQHGNKLFGAREMMNSNAKSNMYWCFDATAC